ncbi:radical SAM protein [Azovibrio restrictus]|uniref:radical SAM protein n=1 Tax=Azovibrio restrictus TaxID=146938 RepID=UPI0026F33EF5|nr:radical SAM protein [Azovibrio restrictus]MDD3484395.1 radical SAM protein [Azovibrio restrictus]
MSNQVLSVTDHRRDRAGLVYVYPVVSRRAGGVSVGINLNVNKACNWACVYCQVEGLSRGGPLPVDLNLLEQELRGFLEQLVQGDYLQQYVAEDCRRVADIAFSGDGEPTSAPEFPLAVARVAAVLERLGLRGSLPVRLITNGSFLHRTEVRDGLAALAALGGEVWFKVDRADPEGMLEANKSRQMSGRVLEHLRTCAAIVPTWVQTCWFARNGREPDEMTRKAYLELISGARELLRGVHLYGLARPSQQPEAGELARIPEEAMRAWGERIEQETGVRVSVSP